jgi:putative NADH-flavin reductase
MKKFAGAFVRIGGAGSLYKDETKRHLFLESIPPEFRAVP